METYPHQIIPNIYYKRIECDLSDYYLIRSTGTKDIKDETTGFVKENHICDPSAHIVDLSTSILGIFGPMHIPIDLTKQGKIDYGDYCNPDAKIELPKYDLHYVINNDKGYWVVPISKIHNTEVDYTLSNNPFKAKCLVRHTPAKWNFWHFSVNWDISGRLLHEMEDKERSKISKKLKHEAKSHVKMFAKTTLPESYNVLSKSEYRKGILERVDLALRDFYNRLFKTKN